MWYLLRMSKKNKEKNLRRKIEILKAQVKTQHTVTSPVRIERIESNTKTPELNDKEIRRALTKTFVFSVSSFVLLAGLNYFGAFDLFTKLLKF
ncbi:hypothetical protein A3H26_00285 [candidate division WWE3 bacterium RIFCSPLOWO2_12_FULL_36_10]|uniref:Uncharacterized protein n=1 Tax=candidate division WWE3 bacterium RIFCSPLOWO2_12_FULL_36_10 TaxID=1802630 RepID=A0A1F4VGE4_UNCKA|nr:MAG: hypothetical protein A3H26_00285 [candidate division WWE3 bacterium RIFCSPLOWO2_12_FULL_36_10]